MSLSLLLALITISTIVRIQTSSPSLDQRRWQPSHRRGSHDSLSLVTCNSSSLSWINLIKEGYQQFLLLNSLQKFESFVLQFFLILFIFLITLGCTKREKVVFSPIFLSSDLQFSEFINQIEPTCWGFPPIPTIWWTIPSFYILFNCTVILIHIRII